MNATTQKASIAATDPTGPTGKLCQWLADFQLDQVPVTARERAKALILDGFACAIVGAQLPWSRKAAQIVQQFEGKGDCTIIGWGATTSAPGAALLNGTFIQGFELDDFHPLAPLHSASLRTTGAARRCRFSITKLHKIPTLT
jgi:2-methylcitrate dehydratase PrpD